MHYPFKTIEPKWQQYWDAHRTFSVTEDAGKTKYYVLDMFPYPSGAGLHVGHPEGYTATDIVARYQRMRGFNVLHPMGWDAFGLPAERAAVREGRHPAIITKENIANFKRQIKRLGLSYDWDREISTSDPAYYRWTQWIFLQLHQKGLAYLAEVPVNWCPAQGTVLANEEVQDGVYVETGDPVERRMMKQWMLQITAYAEQLLEGLDGLDWPEGVLEMQRQWVGRSEGAEVTFQIDGYQSFVVFTTRPDTLYGATYCVFAPEHPYVREITTDAQRAAVEAYIEQVTHTAERDRMIAAERDKTGIFTGAYAINPVNGEKIPIWIADYVMMSYGTGAIMAVPAHDARDHAFAKKFHLDIREVIAGGADVQQAAWSGDGRVVNSGLIDGLSVPQATAKMIAWLTEQGCGARKVTYKLRDWLFSRQRYWGEPFPVAHTSSGTVVALPEDALPITLPELEAFKPTADGRPPLARAEDWCRLELDGATLERETNTMPQWAGSCWYYLRYMDPHNDAQAWSQAAEQYWMPVDLYIGGAEHAVLHLLYARFWHKVLFDLGLVSTAEPFQKLVNQGLILGEDGEKMSKSRGNVVNPDDIIDAHGADAFRMYEMFLGPLEKSKPWNMRGIEGIDRFLQRVWRLLVDARGLLRPTVQEAEIPPALNRALHAAIAGVTDDIEGLRFNTAISKLMVLLNQLVDVEIVPRRVAMVFVQLLSPLAPHLGEELWSLLGHQDSIAYTTWPEHDPALLVDDEVTWIIQVNGRLRSKLTTSTTISEEDIKSAVLEDVHVKKWMQDKPVKHMVVVPHKLVNVVV
jgi:leucyl-tRNA synthetase